MAQLVHMDACLDTLSDKLCKVSTRVSRITRRQAVISGFTVASSLSPSFSVDESDDGSSSDGVDEDDVLAFPVMMRCLLDVLTLCHS